MEYKIDIVFVIAATKGMKPIMEQVKKFVLTFDGKLKREMLKHGRMVVATRLRVIDYADYATEGDEAIRQTDFFVMDRDRQEFEDAINRIECEKRGSESANNAIEALYAAMNSDWTEISFPSNYGRHIIFLITETYPLNLHERADSIDYPKNKLPADINELEEMWSGWDYRKNILTHSTYGKRLVMVVPYGNDAAGHSWDAVSSFELTTTYFAKSKDELMDIPLDGIFSEIIRDA